MNKSLIESSLKLVFEQYIEAFSIKDFAAVTKKLCDTCSASFTGGTPIHWKQRDAYRVDAKVAGSFTCRVFSYDSRKYRALSIF